MTKDIASQNRRFYDAVYRERPMFLGRLLARVSFDQLSKSRRNVSFAKKYLPQDGREVRRILDYGCGRGLFLKAVHRRGDQILGVDISPKAAKLIEDIHWKTDSTCSFMNPDEFAAAQIESSFEIVCCSHVLEHVKDDREVLKALAEALSPEGIVIINVPVNEVFDDPNHCRAYDLDTLLRLVGDSGLEVVEHQFCDRWTAYLLTKEKAATPGITRRILMRALRGMLALLPLPVLEFSERIFVGPYPNQQLVLAARRKNA